MGDNAIFVERKPAGSLFFHNGNGYHYRFLSNTPSTAYFTCIIKSCRGTATFKFGNALIHSQPHNHPPDRLFPQLVNARTEIFKEARSMSYMSFSEIIRMVQERTPHQIVRSHLTVRNLRSSMHRARSSVFPNIPRSLLELVNILHDPAWECLTQTLDKLDRIYLGTAFGSDGSINIVFMSRRGGEMLKLATIVFADGTFFIVPNVTGCYQVFTLVIVHGYTVIPVCWCLMENKSQAAYESVLTLIRNNLLNWMFTRVVCDFEDAMINAFFNVFGVDVQGCLFHSSDAMARWSQKYIGRDLIGLYGEIQVTIRLCCALPLLPQDLLQKGLNAIGAAAMELDFLYEVLRPFLAYVQHDWLDHANRGITMSVCNSEHRTNNASESNNRRMRRKFGVHHPNIFMFIRKLAKFESEAKDDLFSLNCGIIPTRHRPATAVTNDVVIQGITQHLLSVPDPSEAQILHFLHTASHSIAGILQDII